jgi:hypothetical protein
MVKLLVLAPFAMAAALLGVGLVVTSLDTEGKEIQQLAQHGHRAAARAAIEATTAEATQGLANQRYQAGGCVYAGHGALVQPGQVYQLPPGVCVADAYGNTAIVDSNGVAGQLASTQNRTVIQQFLGW